MLEPIPFTTSDVWLLLSIALAETNGEATLASVVEAGDHINHAVFTPQELRRGTAKLLAAHLACFANGLYALTDDGRELYARTADASCIFDQWNAINAALGAVRGPTDDPRFEDPRFTFPELSDATIQAAIRTYIRTGAP